MTKRKSILVLSMKHLPICKTMRILLEDTELDLILRGGSSSLCSWFTMNQSMSGVIWLGWVYSFASSAILAYI